MPLGFRSNSAALVHGSPALPEDGRLQLAELDAALARLARLSPSERLALVVTLLAAEQPTFVNDARHGVTLAA